MNRHLTFFVIISFIFDIEKYIESSRRGRIEVAGLVEGFDGSIEVDICPVGCKYLKMSDEEPGFQRDTLINNQLLHTEYQEANQEFRHRNQLVHNTFYLFIIAAGIFLGLFLQLGLNGNMITVGGLTIALGFVFTIIGHLFLKHFHERSSAEVVRMHAEWIANSNRKRADRALSLEWGIAGAGAKYDEENNRIVRRGSHIHYITKWPTQLVSAESFGLGLIYLGALALVIGVVLVSSVVTSGLLPLIIGTFSAIVITTVYWFVKNQSKAPEDKPIY